MEPSSGDNRPPRTLSGTVKRQVGKFFGIIIEDEKREIQRQKWNESAQKMHGRSLVTKRKAVRPQEPYSSDNVEMDEVDSSPGEFQLRVTGPSKRMNSLQRAPQFVPFKHDNVFTVTKQIVSGKMKKVANEPSVHLRSVKPSALAHYEPNRGELLDIGFYETPQSTAAKIALPRQQLIPASSHARQISMPKGAPPSYDFEDSQGLYDTVDSSSQLNEAELRLLMEPSSSSDWVTLEKSKVRVRRRAAMPPQRAAAADAEADLQTDGGAEESAVYSQVDGATYDYPDGKTLDYLGRKFVEEFGDNSNRHEVGIGLLGHCLGLVRKSNKDLSDEEKAQIRYFNSNTYRPYFTYWVTFVQIVCFIVSVSVYGIAEIGGATTTISGEVLTSSLSVEQVQYTEDSNFWIGPRQADLIHLGAKYSPCMRDDENVKAAIVADRVLENNTACCILNDGSGCVQTSEAKCSDSLATWTKWSSMNKGPDGRVSGSVCGQDPGYCQKPASVGAFAWPDDITKWPVCEVTQNVTSSGGKVDHMSCPLAGRPCCIGVQGQCVITTREFCDFRRGYFHPEASLCSQVSCMSEICGMIPFYNPEKPDQFYRLWVSLFIHAGIFQLLLSVIFQLILMRDLEKLLGWIRMAIIYIFCGIAGSLGSAIFIPYHVEAGPSGSQFGVLACLFVEFASQWNTYSHSRYWTLAVYIISTLVLFAIGLLPMIDNYAHLIGFAFGFPLSFALMPHVWFGVKSIRAQVISVVVCLLLSAGMLAVLIILFYVIGVYECVGCEYFNCIPLTDTFCLTSKVQITRDQDY